MRSNGIRGPSFGPSSIKSGRSSKVGPGRGRNSCRSSRFSTSNAIWRKPSRVATDLTLLEQGKTDKAATGWEVVLQTKSSDDVARSLTTIMIIHFGPGRIRLVQGSITDEEVDAVVNAANARLARRRRSRRGHSPGGRPVADRRDATPSIHRVVRRATPSRPRPASCGARYVFHAVGPVWRGGMQQEAKLLASAYPVGVSNWRSNMSAARSPFRRSARASTRIPPIWRPTAR